MDFPPLKPSKTIVYLFLVPVTGDIRGVGASLGVDDDAIARIQAVFGGRLGIRQLGTSNPWKHIWNYGTCHFDIC